MLYSVFDKLIFAAALVLALQLPLLADHYQQFLAGYLEAMRTQADGYRQTAREFGFRDALAMIDAHERNPSASVRADARQKRQTLATLEQLEDDVTWFGQGNILQKSAYMLHPARYDRLRLTLENFKPGLPLSGESLFFGFTLALLLNALCVLPCRGAIVWYRRRKARNPVKKPLS